jgi:hypothetical protein
MGQASSTKKQQHQLKLRVCMLRLTYHVGTDASLHAWQLLACTHIEALSASEISPAPGFAEAHVVYIWKPQKQAW